jgi:hypothetical protein
MNLALPAPRVEKAIASKVESAEPATAEMARPSHSMRQVQPPPVVEPATTANPELAPPPKFSIPPLSVEGLRMAPGINHFESDVAILPRAPNKNLIQIVFPCCYDDRNFVTYGEAKKYCFIKDTVCYVYNEKTDPMPLYQFSFSKNIYAAMEDRYHPHRYSTTISPEPDTNLPREEMKTVLILVVGSSGTNPLLYQFTFDTSNDITIADRFLALVQSMSHSP